MRSRMNGTIEFALLPGWYKFVVSEQVFDSKFIICIINKIWLGFQLILLIAMRSVLHSRTHKKSCPVYAKNSIYHVIKKMSLLRMRVYFENVKYTKVA